MSGRICFSCGKGRLSANWVSHAHNRNKRVMQANLRKLKMAVNGLNQTVKLCVKCYRQERDKIKASMLTQKAEKIMTASQAAQKEVTYG